MVVGEEVKQRSLVTQVFEENVKRLQKLDAHVIPWVGVKQIDEELEHVLLQEKFEYRRIILIAPNENLGNRPEGLYHELICIERLSTTSTTSALLFGVTALFLVRRLYNCRSLSRLCTF